MTNENGSDTCTELKLLDITLKNAGAIQFSCMGEFTAPSSPEIILSRPGGAVEIYRIESSSGSNDDNDDDSDEEEEHRTWLKLILRTETLSTLRSMETVRLSGEKRDLVLIGSDSGCVSVLDFKGGEKAKILHCPNVGKTGKNLRLNKSRQNHILHILSCRMSLFVSLTCHVTRTMNKTLLCRMSKRHTRPIPRERSQRTCLYDISNRKT